jgi:hypothetical protein
MARPVDGIARWDESELVTALPDENHETWERITQ